MGALRALGAQSMLGFSFSKILFTILMIMAVWWVYKQINRIGDDSGKPKARVKPGRGQARDAEPQEAQTVEDLTACPACGAYAAAGSNPGCGRPAKDCPMQT